MKLDELFSFYRSVLKLCSMEVDDEGLVSITLAGAKKPCMLEGRRLMMPYKARLKDFDKEMHRLFHPLSESLTRGESEVLERIRTVFVMKANYVIGRIGAGLLHLLSTPSDHNKLNITQATLLENVKDNFEGSAAKWSENVVLRMNKEKLPKHVDMRLIKLGTYKGKKYPRLGSVFFPFYETLSNPDSGVNLQVREIKLYKQLTEFMFNTSDQEYSRPSDTDTAPFLYAFIKSAIAIAETLNHLLDSYKDFICTGESDYKECRFDLDGLDAVENLSGMSILLRHLPLQIGNDGRIEVTESQEVAAPVATPNSLVPNMPVGVHPSMMPSFPTAAPASSSPWDAVAPTPTNPMSMYMNPQTNPMNQRPSWMQPNVAPDFGMPQNNANSGIWNSFG